MFTESLSLCVYSSELEVQHEYALVMARILIPCIGAISCYLSLLDETKGGVGINDNR